MVNNVKIAQIMYSFYNQNIPKDWADDLTLSIL
jgi:hypothetical protein